MKKLNQREVQALASRIINDIRKDRLDPINKHNQAIIESEEYLHIIEKSAMAKEFQEALKHYEKEGNSYSEKRIINDAMNLYAKFILKDKFLKHPKIPSITDVEREITIANIDAEGLENLQRRVLANLSK